MRQPITYENVNDANGRPAGGWVEAPGLNIRWQNGPLAGPGGVRNEPNGAFVETVLSAVEQRIEYYQRGEFACPENAEALMHIGKALEALDRRTRDRQVRGVEGTHEK